MAFNHRFYYLEIVKIQNPIYDCCNSLTEFILSNFLPKENYMIKRVGKENRYSIPLQDQYYNRSDREYSAICWRSDKESATRYRNYRDALADLKKYILKDHVIYTEEVVFSTKYLNEAIEDPLEKKFKQLEKESDV